MRYAIFSDIHANLEALEAVLDRIDEIAKENPIDQIWFLGDLVGYGPNPNECIVTLRERTDIVIAGNHDWAAIGKIDLEDFSAAARISAEWTARQLTEEHRNFLSDLPERLEIDDCTLVHGSPYGPLWEYLTSEILAERSFKHFGSRYCLVGHTHVPVIFQQPITAAADDDDTFANAPTLPLASSGQNGTENSIEDGIDEDNDETVELAAIGQVKAAEHAESAYADPKNGQNLTEGEANTLLESEMGNPDQLPVAAGEIDGFMTEEMVKDVQDAPTSEEEAGEEEASGENENTVTEDEDASPDPELEGNLPDLEGNPEEETAYIDVLESAEEISPELIIRSAEEQTNSEIEELLTLLGLTQSMIEVTNEMFAPPEGHWQAPEGYRFIINPGSVGQPRDGDPRAAFMIYDTERGFEFYRVPYMVEKTQEKIIKAGLPQYLAMRLAFGR
jgi:diadenosine tetraphosphatase ApaH/serine/threonine PP2A family protein phosphatase